MLLTHDHHGDNLDAAGRALLPDVPAVVTTVSGARRLGLAHAIGLRRRSDHDADAPPAYRISRCARPRPGTGRR